MALPGRSGVRSQNHEVLNADFDAFMTSIMKEFRIPGASIAVIKGNEIESKGYGERYIDGPPVTTDTLFNAASMSKSLTAGAVGLLVDDKENFPQFTWETPISSLMRDDFVLPDAYADAHTNAVDILSHRTGFFGHDAADHGPRAEIPDTPQSVTRKLRHLRMNKPFRTEFQYNNRFYTAASHLVEVLTKTPFYTFLKTNFWDPLDMSQTISGQDVLPDGKMPTDLTSWSDERNTALGHFYNKDTAQYKIVSYPNEPEGQGAGNIVSTATDFAKWVRSMMQRSNALSPETIHELTKPRIQSSDNEKYQGDRREPLHSLQFYCMGWHCEWYRGHKCLDHSGGIPGFTSIMRYMPEHNFGVVMFGNSAGMGDASEVISWKLIDDFLGIPESERMDWIKRVKASGDDEEGEKKPFPTRPETPIPMPVSLQCLAGKYSHPVFGVYDFMMDEEGRQLVADARDRTFGFWLKLEHVSGPYFVAKMEDVDEDEDNVLEAEFRIAVDGTVRELGIDLENVDGDCDEDREMVWFERVTG